MRGVLACAVMMLHLGVNHIILKLSGNALPGGRWQLSVDFFFILSGFVLARSYGINRPGLRIYFAKRLRRLGPVFVLSTILMWGLERSSLTTAAANLLMVQSLVGVPHLNWPSWSVPFEIFLPIIGLLVAERIRRPRLALAGFALLGAACCVALAMGQDCRFLRAVSGLGFGMFLYHSGWRTVPFANALIAGFCGMLLIMLLCIELPAIAVIFYPLAGWCVLAGANTRTCLSSAPFQALGRWSYGIYLFHVPVLTAAIQWLGVEHITGGTATVAIVVTVLAVSGAAFRFVETPVMRWRAALPS